MDSFVHRENLKLYRKLLAETTDEQKRRTLLKLLADEEARDAQPAEATPHLSEAEQHAIAAGAVGLVPGLPQK
jgi:hypothetical protein